MTLFVNDPDFTLYVGDALEVLQAMPTESVHCCVTSPPYWGLRDYGTGTWDGGDADCDHRADDRFRATSTIRDTSQANVQTEQETKGTPFKDTCGKCGASRVDQQLGLEPTPDQYVTNMVAVFREVRRVLRADGTLWLNIGDSYASQPNQRVQKPGGRNDTAGWKQDTNTGSLTQGSSYVPGLKAKDLIGVPWRLAFALQADGWYLRSDIIWSKPNPMPESVTDRPTKAHEYLFLMSKSPRYFYDADAIREPSIWASDPREGTRIDYNGKRNGAPGTGQRAFVSIDAAGRNKRSVWEIATEAYPDAHFATFPQALVEPCVKAGCPEWVCGTCGKARERIVERTGFPDPEYQGDDLEPLRASNNDADRRRVLSGAGHAAFKAANPDKVIGWSDCGHNNYQAGVVLDPFLGSGTTAQVARKLGRRSIGIELNPEYAELAARRLQQQSLFA